MVSTYVNRLTAICEMLDSPRPDKKVEAIDLLFQLWKEFPRNAEFINNLKEIYRRHPKLFQEFLECIEKLSIEEKRAEQLKKEFNRMFSKFETTDNELGIRKKNIQRQGKKIPETKKVDSDKSINKAKLRIIDLFLASSSELKDDREQVEIWVNRENKKLVEKDFFLRLNIWEDFLDAMSKTRLQDEYNKVVAESDIVICLFATKVGKYTEEEFEVAYANFKEKGKPRYIYTYFKDVQVSTSDMNLNDLVSLQNFKTKLDTLGHFYTTYKSIEDLKGRLNNQLDKVFKEMQFAVEN